MLNVLINFVFYIVTSLSNIIITPIENLLVNNIPALGDLIINAESFLHNYVFLYTGFIKKMFMNFMLFPQTLMSLILAYFMFKVLVYSSMTLVRFGINVYNKFKI